MLIYDFDPQGAATVGLGINANAVEDTVYTALFNPRMDVHTVIQHTDFENLDIMPSNIDLSAAEVQLVTEVGREQVLAGVLRQVKDEYDVIIAHGECADRGGWCDHSRGCRVLRVAWRGFADAIHRKGAVPYQSESGSVWSARHHVHAYSALR